MTPRVVDPDRTAGVEGKILEAARDLMAEGGLAGLSMRQVADRVGTSATALYHYFENKDDLVRRVLNRAFVRFGEYLERAAATHPRGSIERVLALGEAYLKFATENEAYFRVLFSLQRDDPRAIEELPEGGGFDLLRQAVEDAIEAGAMRPVPPDLMALYLWSVAHGVMTITLACRIEECHESTTDGIPSTPLELFRAFRPLVRDGIGSSAGVLSPVGSEGEAR
jgi:AcrR family transcriptional regulator